MTNSDLNKLMDEFLNDGAQQEDDVPSPLKVGDMYRITGGMYKKYKTCQMVKVNPTYSDVVIQSSDCKKGTQTPLNSLHSKVKNCYIHPVQVGVVIEMPEADDLVVVEKLPEEVVDALDDDDVGSDGGIIEEDDVEGEVENITHLLPSLEEALELRRENELLMKRNKELEDRHKLYMPNMNKSEIDWKHKAILKILQ
jgi:hypothetical protein